MKELNKSLSNIDRIKDIIALRNQLLQIVKEKVTYDPATDAITMPKSNYNTLLND